MTTSDFARDQHQSVKKTKILDSMLYTQQKHGLIKYSIKQSIWKKLIVKANYFSATETNSTFDIVKHYSIKVVKDDDDDADKS